MKKGTKKRRRALDAYQSLQRAAAYAAAGVDEALHDYGLSASQFGVLDTLEARGPLHQQELAETLSRSKAQMTAIIDALESRGLARRERHAVDRRYITVHLTLAGRDVLEEVRPVRVEAIVYMMRELTAPQRIKLLRLCRRLLPSPVAEADVDGNAEESDGAPVLAAAADLSAASAPQATDAGSLDGDESVSETLPV